jgi:hypothetical protein
MVLFSFAFFLCDKSGVKDEEFGFALGWGQFSRKASDAFRVSSLRHTFLWRPPGRYGDDSHTAHASETRKALVEDAVIDHSDSKAGVYGLTNELFMRPMRERLLEALFRIEPIRMNTVG